MTAARNRSRPTLSLSGLSAAFEASLRALAAALCMLALADLGAATLGFMPWAVLALPAGATLATTWRWGVPASAGSACGIGLAAVGLGLPPSLAGLLVLGVALTSAAGWAVLRLVRFDDRLERPADVGALAVVVVGVVALPLAAMLAAWTVASQATDPFAAWVEALAVIAIGSVASAVGVLALDRSLPGGRQSTHRWRRLLTAAAGVAAVLWLMWFARDAKPPWPTMVSMLPHLLVVTLALRGQLTLATWGLIAATLLMARGPTSTAVWPVPPQGGAELAALAASALLLMLLSHAAMVSWRGRAQRWEWALDGTGMGVADWHLRREETFASTAWCALVGDTQPAWSPVRWQAQVHPEDQAELVDAIRALTAGDVGRRRVELRLPHAGSVNGSSLTKHSRPEDWHWAEATLMVIERDSVGQPVRLLATLSDVQERRAAQERQLMSVSLFQHLHEGLLITDPDLRALDANPAYTQILGVPRDELLGTVPSLLQPVPDDPLAREQRASMWAGLASQGSWRGELLERRRNGEPCTLQATISVVRGPVGDLRYHVLVISDISEQRTQREQLVRQAHYDELTRLPNRAHLSKLLDDAMASADRNGTLLVVCYLDLDRFKPINDRFGHAAGDRLLGELAGRLRSALRSRTNSTDSAARLGGDEFVLLLFAETMDEGRLA
ncbi:MAG: diguanylate cyclase, partial [Rubrivivax sp.]